MQLFILPYAGGSIAAFRRLTDLIDERIDTVTVEYPGRGTRIKESLAKDIESLIDDASLYCLARRQVDVPYAIMGYSMGSILAYEMLSRNVLPGVLKHFFVSAEVSPKDRSIELRKVLDPTDERILERVKKLGGLNERMLQDTRFAEIYIKPMLSDYRLFFSYHFNGQCKKIKTDTTFFYCEEDTALEDVAKWSELIEGQFCYHEIGNNHFFINQYYKEMAGIINQSLCSIMG